MIFICKCSQKIRIKSPPPKKTITIKCPMCSYTNTIVDGKGEEFCFICNNNCLESNILQNGKRYHVDCLHNLQSTKTIHDAQISNYKNNLHKIERSIANEYNSRSFFSKLIGKEPETIDIKKNEKSKILNKISSVKQEKEELLRSRKAKLSNVYDYWLTRPPDWKNRTFDLRKETEYCSKCGEKRNNDNPLHVHHIIPIAHGGNHKIDNLTVLCYDCHQNEHPFKFNNNNNNEFKQYNSVKKSYYEVLLDKIELSAKQKELYLSFVYKRFEGIRDKHLVQVHSIYSKNGVMHFNGFCVLSHSTREFNLRYMSKVDISSVLPNYTLPVDYISNAMIKNLLIYCIYTKITGDKSVRTLKPIQYTSSSGIKVLECYDYLTGEVRNFALHRMSKIELVKKPKVSKRL